MVRSFDKILLTLFNAVSKASPPSLPPRGEGEGDLDKKEPPP